MKALLPKAKVHDISAFLKKEAENQEDRPFVDGYIPADKDFIGRVKKVLDEDDYTEFLESILLFETYKNTSKDIQLLVDKYYGNV